MSKFISYEKAKQHVRKLNLKSQRNWYVYCKSGTKSKDIPSDPSNVYSEKWTSWGDWLGTGNVASSTKSKNWTSWEDAKKIYRKIAKDNNIKSQKDWKEYVVNHNLPKNLPKSPERVYRNSWKGVSDGLGIEKSGHSKNFVSFSEAKKIVQKLKIENQKDWKSFCKSNSFPKNIPRSPEKTCSEHWISWGDWLGTGRIANQKKQYRKFSLARKYSRGLKISTVSEWLKFCKLGTIPDDIPVSPNMVYKNKGWISWGDWLGTNKTGDKK